MGCNDQSRVNPCVKMKQLNTPDRAYPVTLAMQDNN